MHIGVGAVGLYALVRIYKGEKGAQSSPAA